MNSFWRIVGKIVSFDLTRRTWTRKVEHPRLGKLTYFGSKNPADCYWEVDVALPGQPEKAGVTMTGTPEGPTEREEAFIRLLVEDVDVPFERCRRLFDSEYIKMGKGAIPAEWRSVMRLDGFSVPLNGDEQCEWEACFYVEPLGHYFIASFEKGNPVHVSVDG